MDAQVRKYTAEQLYLQLLEGDMEDDQEASDLLLETAWDSRVQDLQLVHLQLREMLNLT